MDFIFYGINNFSFFELKIIIIKISLKYLIILKETKINVI